MTASARVEYVISAADKTRQAVDSVKRGFSGIEQAVSSMSKTMGLIGKGAGAALLIQSFRAAMSAGTQLQETVDRLGYALSKDQAAAVARADKAWTTLSNSFESARVSVLTALGPAVEWLAKLMGTAVPKAVEFARKAFEALRFTVLAVAEKAVSALEWFYDMLGNLPGNIGQTYRDAAARMGELAEKIQTLRDGYLDASAPLEAFTAGIQAQSTVLDGYLKKMNAQTRLEMERNFEWIEGMQRGAGRGSDRDSYRRSGINPQIALEMERNFEWIEDMSRTTMHGMSEYAKSAAQNMQTHFANFLFDPFEDGLKGMLKGFIDTLRQIGAERAASKVFEGLFGKDDGKGGTVPGILGTFLSGLFGGAKAGGGAVSAGKLYRVNENGTEYFKPAGDGQVIPIGGGGGGGAPVVNITTHIDARGATSDLAGALPEIMKRNNEALEAKIIEGLRRKRYAL